MDSVWVLIGLQRQSSEIQQRQEATFQTTILSTRTAIRIGMWNIRTMFDIGKAAQVAVEMRNYQLTI